MADAAAPWATERAVMAVACRLARERGGEAKEWLPTAERILRLPEVAYAITAVCARVSTETSRATGNAILGGLGLEPIEFGP